MTHLDPSAWPPLNQVRVITDFEVSFRRQEVLRLLGLRDSTPVKPSIDERISTVGAEALRLIRPAAIYGIFEPAHVTRLSFPTGRASPIDRVAVAVVTIGALLEEAIKQLDRGGDLAQALILDAYGSELAEAAADRVEHLIDTEARTLKLKSPRRISPGYGAFELLQQRIIFDLLRPEQIGVKLTSSSLMIPRKSISFVKPLGAKSALFCADAELGCDRCDHADCAFRRQPTTSHGDRK